MYFNDWSLDPIKEKMLEMTAFEMQKLYLEKEKEYSDACGLYIKLLKTEFEEEQKEKCDLLEMEIYVIARTITDRIIKG